MGKKRARTKRTKTKHTHSGTIWKGVEREVKRQEIDKANQEAASKADPSVQDTKGIEAIQNQKSTAGYEPKHNASTTVVSDGFEPTGRTSAKCSSG